MSEPRLVADAWLSERLGKPAFHLVGALGGPATRCATVARQLGASALFADVSTTTARMSGSGPVSSERELSLSMDHPLGTVKVVPAAVARGEFSATCSGARLTTAGAGGGAGAGWATGAGVGALAQASRANGTAMAKKGRRRGLITELAYQLAIPSSTLGVSTLIEPRLRRRSESFQPQDSAVWSVEVRTHAALDVAMKMLAPSLDVASVPATQRRAPAPR